MGTVVFPEAEVKFFLTAEDAERARRRWLELRQRDPELTLEAVAAELAARDDRDSSRKISPLRPAPDAVILDSTGLSVEEVVARMKEVVHKVASRS